MRADRLVAIVLLLQRHGQRTAGQLAEALETSERTIRRDLDALSMAGVPVYAQRGRGGGWALLGGHRIDLSGLTGPEARALVLAAAGAPDQEGVEAALRKVLAALPPPLRDQVAAARARVHVDPRAWRGRPAKEGPDNRELTADPAADRLLGRLRRAVEEGVQVDLTYARPGQAATPRRVHPHGLVVKAGSWYLVASTTAGLRTYKVARIDTVEPTEDPRQEPDGFDLAATWATMQREFAALRPVAELTVELLADEGAWLRLSAHLGAWWDLVDLGSLSDGRRHALVAVPNAAHAARELVAFGDAVEVVGPASVRHELAGLGQRLVERYAASALACSAGLELASSAQGDQRVG